MKKGEIERAREKEKERERERERKRERERERERGRVVQCSHQADIADARHFQKDDGDGDGASWTFLEWASKGAKLVDVTYM